jgi:hypothetical protein
MMLIFSLIWQLHLYTNTVESGMELIDFDRNKFVMVIQGWDWNDYASCVEQIREQ